MPQFSFFPHFPTDNVDVRINRLHLFNFWNLKDSYIMDSQVRQKLEKFCALHVNTDLEKLNSPAIAVIDNEYTFPMLSDEQLKDLQRYALALLFCSIMNNRVNSVSVSEQFALHHQNFTLEEDAIVFTTGSFYNVQNWQSFEMTKLVRPGFVPANTFDYRFDKKLMAAFANMIDAHNDDEDYLFKVLEWVRYAFLNAEGYSYESRNVMMATAFEIFFGLPEIGKEDAFAKRLEDLLEVSNMEIKDEGFNLVQTGHTSITKLNARGRSKTSTMYGWWARDFYSLRSKIVHEGVVERNDLLNHNDKQHLLIAIAMLNFCFYRLLENRGYLTFETIQNIPEFAGVSWERISKEDDLREIEDLIA